MRIDNAYTAWQDNKAIRSWAISLVTCYVDVGGQDIVSVHGVMVWLILDL